MPAGELPGGDPRILESPVEAGLELADLAGRRLPSLRLRSGRLLSLGVLWTLSVIFVAGLTLLYLQGLLESGGAVLSLPGLAYIMLSMIFFPSMGFGLALVMLAYKERQFLPFLEKASGAMTALETGPPEGAGPEGGGAGGEGGDSLAGILGSAISIGNLVPTVERMAVAARGVLALLILGLVSLPVLVAFGLLIGTTSAMLAAMELVVLVVLAYPALSLFRDLSGDLRFYRYYSRRHRAIAEAATVGPPPVPDGPDPPSRFDRHLRELPPVKTMLNAPGARVEDGPGGIPQSRLYTGGGRGIIVRLFEGLPDRPGLDDYLAGSRRIAGERELTLLRAVALVAPGGADIDDALYDYIIGLGERTRPGECPLQLVMEVEGAYSMVPFVAS